MAKVSIREPLEAPVPSCTALHKFPLLPAFIDTLEETARFYGEGLHPKALETHMYRHVKPVVAQLRSEVAPPGDRRIQGGGSNNGQVIPLHSAFLLMI